ncbi:MAG: hypothetical protein JO162_00390 [Alphaproteobacteria bacterium]|nr:hypothetical protein [Alphaproteobacteria bacterium]MBV9015363.1 hypothetical protein [Alphaproteobacteria bacterium]MBV9154326.1 hypothetical protein [Alphaproteobacteria bacterium]MBV9585189.1 hypothetical protein [Alphaproteobacteria bacterium]
MRDDGLPRQSPTIEPGQIWLVEHDPAELSLLDRAVLSGANVVLYDRALGPVLAQSLPLGAYAEPLPPTFAAAAPAIAPRALDFAAEGWSVVQLVAAGPAWRARLPILPPRLNRAHREAGLPVQVSTKDAHGRAHDIDSSVEELAELLRGYGSDERLTLVFGPLVAHRATPAHAFTANGLAG